jgi:hypothetical protein
MGDQWQRNAQTASNSKQITHTPLSRWAMPAFGTGERYADLAIHGLDHSPITLNRFSIQTDRERVLSQLRGTVPRHTQKSHAKPPSMSCACRRGARNIPRGGAETRRRKENMSHEDTKAQRCHVMTQIHPHNLLTDNCFVIASEARQSITQKWPKSLLDFIPRTSEPPREIFFLGKKPYRLITTPFPTYA